jgi:hypothetical protein
MPEEPRERRLTQCASWHQTCYVFYTERGVGMTTKVVNQGNQAVLDRENADRERRLALHTTLQRTAPSRFGNRYTGRERVLLWVAWTATGLLLASLLAFVYFASQSYMFHY